LRTIAVIALKGGSGKTTLATHLALAAHLRGLQTLLADTDPQRSATEVMKAREGGGPIVTRAVSRTLVNAQLCAISARNDLMIIDTAAGAVEDVSEAIVVADLCLMVVRPTLLDIAALVRTVKVVGQLAKPSLVVMSQAPVAREGSEAPVVKRAMRALEYMRLPVSPVIVRNRAIYQTSLETGRSAEESADRTAADEIAALWEIVEKIAFAPRDEQPRMRALG
jgi:chromosome partitioning protein